MTGAPRTGEACASPRSRSALEQLDAAEAIFRQHGAKLYLDRVIAKQLELQGARADSRSAVVVADNSLTSNLSTRELEVLALVARGLSNRATRAQHSREDDSLEPHRTRDVGAPYGRREGRSGVTHTDAYTWWWSEPVHPTWVNAVGGQLVLLLGYPNSTGALSASVGRVLGDEEAVQVVAALADLGDLEGSIPYDAQVEVIIEGEAIAGMSGGAVVDNSGRLTSRAKWLTAPPREL